MLQKKTQWWKLEPMLKKIPWQKQQKQEVQHQMSFGFAPPEDNKTGHSADGYQV